MTVAIQSKNRGYIRGLKAQFNALPKEAAIEASVLIFRKMVELTRFDSGQAALNWRIQTFSGSPKFEPQKILWGYSGNAPKGLADYKFSKGRKAAAVQSELIEFAYAMKVIMQRQKFDGISVYNPITPGFSGFFPGNDEYYEKVALGSARSQAASAVGVSISEMKQILRERHNFVGGR